jgi:hypothetical protein
LILSNGFNKTTSFGGFPRRGASSLSPVERILAPRRHHAKFAPHRIIVDFVQVGPKSDPILHAISVATGMDILIHNQLASSCLQEGIASHPAQSMLFAYS